MEWVNRTFAPILASHDDVESGAVAYSPSVPAVTTAGAVIETRGFLHERDEAQRILELVRESNGTAAILVRARSHLVEIVRVLKRHGIWFQAIEIDELGERQVVEDLMALTFALLHAADRVSWMAILRAPWCGLTLQDLHALANPDPKATIWELLHRSDIALSGDGRARIERILPVLEHALQERGRRALRDWVENAWLRLGGPACVADETALEDASAFFDLLEGLASGADLADFQWFREQVSALFANPDTKAGPQLQLLTIFKAKGLEFDTVIVPGLGVPPRQDDPGLLMWLEQRGELLLAPVPRAGEKDPIYEYLKSLERRKAEHETARLLYVAATRARERLHLLGVIKLKSDSVGEPSSSTFLKLLWPAYGPSFANLTPASATQVANPVRAIRRLPANWRVPDPPPPVASRPRERSLPAVTQPSFEWVSDRLRHTGKNRL